MIKIILEKQSFPELFVEGYRRPFLPSRCRLKLNLSENHVPGISQIFLTQIFLLEKKVLELFFYIFLQEKKFLARGVREKNNWEPFFELSVKDRRNDRMVMKELNEPRQKTLRC